jgi:hypothetical protein
LTTLCFAYWRQSALPGEWCSGAANCNENSDTDGNGEGSDFGGGAHPDDGIAVGAEGVTSEELLRGGVGGGGGKHGQGRRATGCTEAATAEEQVTEEGRPSLSCAEAATAAMAATTEAATAD